jgi:hypothetical protein
MSTPDNDFPPQKRSSKKGTPSSTHPPEHAYGAGDHSFTLQAIMEMQKTLGHLESSIQELTKSVDSVKSKVDDLVKWKYMILGGAAVIGFMIGIAALIVKLAG